MAFSQFLNGDRQGENAFYGRGHIVTLSTMATIRVSEDIYKEVNRVAGRLRQESGHPVSMDDVLELHIKTRGLKLSDFQGAWKIADSEAEDLFKSLRKRWSHWKYPSE